MVTPDGSTIASAKEKKKPVNRAARGGWSFLPDDRTGAAVLRSLRYSVRDPKIKSAFVSALAIGLLIPVVNAVQGTGSVYLACFASGMIGLQMYNQFGQDTSAFWMVAQTISSTRDAYVELRARALALALVTVPYTVVVAALTAGLLGDWAGLPGALGLGLALLGSMLCTGALSSAFFAYSIPTDGAFKNVAPGQGALAWGSLFTGMLASALISSPVIALAIYFSATDQRSLAWILLPLGVVWGTLATWAGLRIAAPTVARKLPEILLAVSKG